MDIVRHLHNETMSEVNHQLICVNEIPSMPGRRNQYKIKGVMHGFLYKWKCSALRSNLNMNIDIFHKTYLAVCVYPPCWSHIKFCMF